MEQENRLEARLVAAAAEKKRHAKLRRARERENRRKAAFEKARHDEEMARIERWVCITRLIAAALAKSN